MPGRTQDAWNEVGERFSAWGRVVAERYRETEAEGGQAAQESQRRLEETARELAEQLNRAFTALGDTLRDEQAKVGLKAAVHAVGDAVAVTVAETGEAIRRRVGSGGDQPPTNEGQTPTS
jgi:hypothetical protein